MVEETPGLFQSMLGASFRQDIEEFALERMIKVREQYDVARFDCTRGRLLKKAKAIRVSRTYSLRRYAPYAISN